MFKTTILACALAALVGCRERSARVDDDPSFSRPVESDRMTFETPGATEEHTVQPAPSSVETPSTGMHTQSGTQSLDSNPPAANTPAPSAPSAPSAPPANVDDDADTSSIPTPGGTNGISSDPRAGAGDTSGAGARAVPPQGSTPQGTNVQPGQPTTGQPPVTLDPATPAGEGQGQNTQTGIESTGTSETASGHGTPTNTGVNTENAGTGGTDDPTR